MLALLQDGLDLGGRQRLLGLLVRHELDGAHGAQAARVADDGHGLGPAVEALLDDLADLLRLAEDVLLFEYVEDGQCGGAGHRIAAVGPSDGAQRGGIDDLRASDDGGERHAGRQRLADRDEVGDDALVLHGPELAGAPEAGLDLVDDEYDAVLIAEPAQAAEEALGGHDEAALAQDGLDDDGGHVLRRHVGQQHLVEARQGVLRQLVGRHADRRPVGIGQRGVEDVGGEGADPGAQRPVLAVEGQAQQSAAVEAVLEADDAAPLGEGAGELDGVLDGLGAAVEERGFARALEAGGFHQLAADLEIPRIGADVEAGVQELARLLAQGGHHLRVAMADVDGADAPGEIDVSLAVGVPNGGVVRPLGDDFGVAGPAGGDELGALRPKRGRFRFCQHK